MSKFLKHVGKHGDRKVAVIFRQIPGEEHMCLVVYTETLGQNVHDPLIAAIESPQGQQGENLADELNRTYTKDGRIILQFLHSEGMMKKVQTQQITMTPAPNQSVRLNELNDILNEMAKGEEAVRRLAEMDASRGLQDPKDVAKRRRGESTMPPVKNSPQGLLGDSELANNFRTQAAKMAAEARGLLAESERLISEADKMEGITSTPTKKKSTAKVVPPAVVEAPVKKTRSRKATVTG